MPAIAQSFDYRVDVGMVFIGLVRNACHGSLNCGAKIVKNWVRKRPACRIKLGLQMPRLPILQVGNLHAQLAIKR